MIDRKAFNEIFQYFDKGDTIEIIDIYLSSYQKEFNTIHSSIAKKDFHNLANSTCKLRGMVSYFCDPLVTEQSRRLENMTRNNDKIEDGLETLFEELEVNHKVLVAELEKMKEELVKDYRTD